MASVNIPGLTDEEKETFSRLDTYIKIQDFLESIDYNLEEKGYTCYSPRMVLRERKADCIEGAIFAAACLYYNGQPPLLGQLMADHKIDDDHIIGLFRHNGLLGALSKSKYPGLGFREPIFRNMRELTLSYFESYFSYEGKKSLLGFTRPLDLRLFDKRRWVTEEKDLFYIADHLEKLKLIPIISPDLCKELRPVTQIMKESGEIWINKKGLMGYLKDKFSEE